MPNSSTSTTTTKIQISSEDVVSKTIQKGLFERGSLSLAAGLAIGGLASIILSRGGGSRKAIAGFGAGAGIGSAWTHCSLELEGLLKNR